MKLFASACIATGLIGFVAVETIEKYQNYFFVEPRMGYETTLGLGKNTQESQSDFVTKVVINEPKSAQNSVQKTEFSGEKFPNRPPNSQENVLFWGFIGACMWGLWKAGE